MTADERRKTFRDMYTRYQWLHERYPELYELAIADLPCVTSKDYSKMMEIRKPGKGERKTRYASTLELFNGKFLERTWAIRWKNDKMQYKEVVRRLEGSEHILVRDMYYTRLGGYNTIWEAKRSGYNCYEPEDFWYCYEGDYYNVCDHNLYTLDDAIKLDPTIKYCAWPNNGYFIGYVTKYRTFPELEMYSKLGLLHLSTDSRFHKRLKREDKFRKYVLKNRLYISDHRVNYVDILNAYKRDISVNKYFNYKNIYNNRVFIDNRAFLEHKIDNLLDYFEKQNCDVGYYMDYYSAAREFTDMTDSKNLYPKNLIESHDQYINMLDEKVNSDIIESFKQVSNKYLKLNYKRFGLMIKIAGTLQELRDEGKTLNHCVGKMGYDKKMAKEESLIFFIRKEDEMEESFYTVELDPNEKKVMQCRTRNNAPANESVNQFLDSWKSYIQKIKVGEASYEL